jgi:hypothetical protein
VLVERKIDYCEVATSAYQFRVPSLSLLAYTFTLANSTIQRVTPFATEILLHVPVDL